MTRRAPTVVAIAAGSAKVTVIRGVVATGVHGVLVTDVPTERGVIG